MSVPEFIRYHRATLEREEVKHGLIVNALTRAKGAKSADLSYWTLGRPGACAIKVGHHSIVLGELVENQCRKLADLTADTDYPGVIGPDLTASWFTDRARELGLSFRDPEPQQIYAISGKPRYPGSLGHVQPVTIEDGSMLADWLTAFQQEAVPHDPLPSRKGRWRIDVIDMEILTGMTTHHQRTSSSDVCSGF